MPGRTRGISACYSGTICAAFFASMVAGGTLLLSPPAQGGSDCAAIADRPARLQCFTAVPEITAKVGLVVDGETMDICIGTWP